MPQVPAFLEQFVISLINDVHLYHVVEHCHDDTSGSTIVTLNLWKRQPCIAPCEVLVVSDPYEEFDATDDGHFESPDSDSFEKDDMDDTQPSNLPGGPTGQGGAVDSAGGFFAVRSCQQIWLLTYTF